MIFLHSILFLSAFLSIHTSLNYNFSLISTIFIICICLPTLYIFLQWAGTKFGLLILLIIGLLGLGIEIVGLLTGFPYGVFSYGAKSGILIFKLVPITTPFSWTIILLGISAFVDALNFNHTRNKYLASILAVVYIDLLLDPVAVRLGLWNWREPGFYYGVPLINYIGWLLSAAIGIVVFNMLTKKFVPSQNLPVTGIGALYFLFIFLLSSAFLSKLYLPFLIGCLPVVVYRKILFKAIGNFVYG